MYQDDIEMFVKVNNARLPSNMEVRVESVTRVARDNECLIPTEARCYVGCLNNDGEPDGRGYFHVCSGKGMQELSDNFDIWFIKFNAKLTFYTREHLRDLCVHGS